jgi:hypothetical protein
MKLQTLGVFGISVALIFFGGCKRPTDRTSVADPAPENPPAATISKAPVPSIPPETSKFRESLTDLSTTFATLDFEKRANAMQKMIEELSPGEIPAAFHDVSQRGKDHPDDLAREMQIRLLQRWAEQDPVSASSALPEIPAEAKREAITRVASAWARQSSSDAVAWARQLPDENSKVIAISGIVAEIANTQPSTALSLAVEIPASPTRDELVSTAVRKWASDTPAAALAWARELNEPELRERTLASIAPSMAETDPAAAAEVAAALPPGQQQEKAVLGVVERWGLKDPEAARAWVARFPDGTFKERALSSLARVRERLNRQAPSK